MAALTLNTPIPTVPETQSPKYEFLRKLDGAEGFENYSIELVRRQTDNRTLVRKVIDAAPNTNGIKEMQILRFLNHANIVQCVDCFLNFPPSDGEKSEWPIGELYMTYCEAGTLADVMNRSCETGVKVPEPFIWHMFFSVLNALIYCQTGYRTMNNLRHHTSVRVPGWTPIAHRDINPENIFCRTPAEDLDRYPKILLGDFGRAETLIDSDDSAGRLGYDVIKLIEIVKKLFEDPMIDTGELSRGGRDFLANLGEMIVDSHPRLPLFSVVLAIEEFRPRLNRTYEALAPQLLDRTIVTGMYGCLG